MATQSKSRRGFLKKGATLGASLLAFPYVITPARAAPPHRMIFGHTFGASTADYVITGLPQFKELAEKYSGGQLLVDIHEAGSLGGQTVLPQKVLGGSIQGCQISTTNFANFSDVYNLLDLPYLFDSNEQFERTIEKDGFFKSEFVTRPAAQGFQIVPGMWANAGFRVLGMSKKAPRTVRLPADLKGIKVRTNGTRVEEVMFKLTTANPVSIAWGEAYQALAQGTADALSVGIGPITATKIHEALSSASFYNLNFNCHVTMLSKQWFDQLPADVRDGIMRAGRESWEHQKREQKKADTAMLKLWKDTGINLVTLTAAEKAAWKSAVGYERKEYDAFKKSIGGNALAELIKLKA